MKKLTLALVIALCGAAHAEQPTITLGAIEQTVAKPETQEIAATLLSSDAQLQDEVTSGLKLSVDQKAEFKSFFARHKTAIYTLGAIILAVGVYAGVGAAANHWKDANGNWFKKACDKTYGYGYEAQYAPFNLVKEGWNKTKDGFNKTYDAVKAHPYITASIVVALTVAALAVYDLTRASDKSVIKKLYHKLFDAKKAEELLAEEAKLNEVVVA